MNALNLSLGALVVVLEAAATYCTLISAYLFARPVLRRQSLQTNLLTFETAASDDPNVEALRNSVINSTRTLLLEKSREESRDNRLAMVFLVVSGMIFLGATVLHLEVEKSREKQYEAIAAPSGVGISSQGTLPAGHP